ncbi:tail protein X [Oscillospiraceae bacterium OttesenSCG-928-G22]|nr:tail protein X [Oscillospiraceae bacterium OttesenSCG-928-G22]
MAQTYTTKQGDAWDAIAFQIYGDEKYTGYLMRNNFPMLDTFVFPAGVVLQTPDLPTDRTTTDMPIWREQ